MPRSPRLVLVSLFALATMLLGASAAHAYPDIGISQSYRDFGLKVNENPAYQPDEDVSRSVYWAPLNANRLRVIVPWDLAGRPAGDGRRQEFENWLKRVKELGGEPFVVFGTTERSPSTDDVSARWSNVQTRCCASGSDPDGDLVAPSGAVYREAVKAFLQTWGPGTGTAARAEVRIIGAWNEPNVGQVFQSIPNGIQGRVFLAGANALMNEVQPACVSGATATNCGPFGVAWFWVHAKNAMAEVCGNCTVVAGEFNSNLGNKGSEYWNTYAAKIESIGQGLPKVISYHGHHDVMALGTFGANDCTSSSHAGCITQNFRAWRNNRGGAWATMQVWDTEVGVQHEAGTSPSTDDIAQRNRFNHLIALQEQYGVSRLYYYNFQHQGGVNDRSLINTRVGHESEGVNTVERPIWNAIRCRPANECTWNRPKPIITTNAASGVTQTTATVSGAVNTMGYDTGVNLEYGTTTAYGSTAYNVATIPDARTTAQPVSATLTGLQPGTTYHYRIVALNLATGATYGADQTFTTTHASQPVALRDPSTAAAWVYYRGTDGKLQEIYRNPTNGQWIVSPYAGTQVAPGTDPVVIAKGTAGPTWIYFQGTDGKVQELYRNPTTGIWSGPFAVPGTQAAAGSTPVVLADPTVGPTWIYYRGTDGKVTEAYRNPTNGQWIVSPYAGTQVAPGTDPVVIAKGTAGPTWIYFQGTDGKVQELYRNPTTGIWSGPFAVPGAEAMPSTNPAVLADATAGPTWIYYQGINGKIYEAYRNPTTGEWSANPFPGT